jgi:hypothetical protein
MTGDSEPEKLDDTTLNRRGLLFLTGASVMGLGTSVAFATQTQTQSFNSAVDVRDSEIVYTTDTFSQSNVGQGPYGNDPSWDTVRANQSGDVHVGDLLMADTASDNNGSDFAGDIELHLSLVDLTELDRDLRSMNLEIGVYEDDGSAWVSRTSNILTLENGTVQFALSQTYDGRYALTIEDGSFRAKEELSGENLDVKFFLEFNALGR